MCGIAGMLDLREARTIDLDVLQRMTRTLSLRGPDGEGYHTTPGVGLGHRRLSIIDLEGGDQPIYNTDGSVVTVYNGEIYNFEALRQELEGLGYHFRTRSDTEVIVHGWDAWGEACVERFNGMFALAVWDENRRCLFLARDRIGIKPLYYGTTRDGFLVFGSELKALLEHPGLERRLRADAIEDFFAFGYVPDPKSILEGVHKLPPGYTLRIERGGQVPEPRRYWDVEFPTDPVAADGRIDEIPERLAHSVGLRMIADVPLGAFLSGGVDSSAVVGLMAQQSEAPVNTSSISFGDPAYNESQFAEMVAKQFETNHQVRQVDPADYSLVERLPEIYDEPFADSSALPTYRVCELARGKVKVALSGDGGDENFIGYRRYRWHAYEERVRRLLPQAIRGPLFGTAGRLYPKLDRAPKFLRAKSTLQALGRDSLAGYLHSVSIYPDAPRQRLYSPSLQRALGGYRAIDTFRGLVADKPELKGLPLVQYLDFKTYLPGDILTKVDRVSMANSLEVRVPILDHEFVAWVARLRPEDKLVGREGKVCFKKSLESLLPHDVLYRDKMGFGVPVASWFRNELRDPVRERIAGGALADSGLFDNAELATLVDDHQAGRRDHSAVLWAMLMFEGSLRHLGASAPAT
ncbi:MAG: XrtA/PEP-CTERM system amidotransferase [Pseudomonadota bacterium]